jgi:hypothetical protein
MHRQAVLIQDISGFRAMVDPQLQRLIEPFLELGLSLDAILLWTIREQLWKVYQLSVANHFPKQSFERELYNRLTVHCVDPRLSDITRHFIKVPRVYGDQELSLELNRCDLIINYYLYKPLIYPL